MKKRVAFMRHIFNYETSDAEFRVYEDGQVRVSVWQHDDLTGGEGRDWKVDDFCREFGVSIDVPRQLYREYAVAGPPRIYHYEDRPATRCAVKFAGEYVPDAQPEPESEPDPYPTTTTTNLNLKAVLEASSSVIFEMLVSEIEAAGFTPNDFDYAGNGKKSESSRLAEGWQIAVAGRVSFPANSRKPFRVDSQPGEDGNRVYRTWVAGTVAGHESNGCECWDSKSRAPGHLCKHNFAARFAWLAYQLSKIQPVRAA
jgi:hypothetical protein